MSPSPNRQAVAVGLFVLAAVAVLSGAILMVGDLNDTFTRKIVVTTVFDEVNGLQRGDNIWFSGLKVGIVKGLSFHEASRVEVVMKIDRAAVPYIHADALTKIGSDGLIGNRIVILYGGTAATPTLVEGDVLVAGEAVTTDEIIAELRKSNANLLAITDDLKVVTRTLAAGEGTVGKLLADDTLYTSVSASADSLKLASNQAVGLTTSLSTFARTLNQPGNLPHDLATDDHSYAAFNATVQQLQQTGARAGELVDGLARGATDPATPLGTLLHGKSSGTDVKSTLANLQKSSVLLNENLEGLQHNVLLRGYFRRKARADAAEAAKAGAAQDKAVKKSSDAEPITEPDPG